jgi:hypothetical protein
MRVVEAERRPTVPAEIPPCHVRTRETRVSYRVIRKSDLSTRQITAKGPPTAFWHMRQWQTWTLLGALSKA